MRTSKKTIAKKQKIKRPAVQKIKIANASNNASNGDENMGRGILIVACTAFLGGCALPVPVQIASWALDGISLLATEKSLTDHGISMVTKKDCALWRGVTGREICVDNTDDAGTVLLASAEPSVAPKPEEPVLVTSIAGGEDATPTPNAVVTVEELVDFDTASGSVAARPVEQQQLPVFDPDDALVETERVLNTREEGQRLLIPGRRMWSSNQDASLYYVIGSFSRRDNARKFVRGHSDLGPAVMASRLDGKEVYRVAVGPFGGDQKLKVRRKIYKAGLKDAWAIRIDHTDWMIAARPAPKPFEPLAEAVPVMTSPPLVSSGEDAPEVIKPGDDQMALAGDGTAAKTEAGDLYYVIGSFDIVDNARSFATETQVGGQEAYKVSYEPAVVSAMSGDKWRHRVVVGPFAENNRETVLGDLALAGIGEPWSIRIPKSAIAYSFNAASASAALTIGASAPQIAGAVQDLPGSG